MGNDPLYDSTILEMKAEALFDANRTEDAAKLFQSIVLTRDSLNQAVAINNEEILQSNYLINQSLAEKEHRAYLTQMLEILIATLFILGLIIAIIHTISLR